MLLAKTHNSTTNPTNDILIVDSISGVVALRAVILWTVEACYDDYGYDAGTVMLILPNLLMDCCTEPGAFPWPGLHRSRPKNWQHLPGSLAARRLMQSTPNLVLAAVAAVALSLLPLSSLLLWPFAHLLLVVCHMNTLSYNLLQHLTMLIFMSFLIVWHVSRQVATSCNSISKHVPSSESVDNPEPQAMPKPPVP